MSDEIKCKGQLKDAVEFVRRYLPNQNPSHSYIHNNPLQNWEDRRFSQAIANAAKLYKAKAWRSLHYYQHSYARGRIKRSDLVLACGSYLMVRDQWAGRIPADSEIESETLANLLLTIGDSIPDDFSKIRPSELSLELAQSHSWMPSLEPESSTDEVHRCPAEFKSKIQTDSELARAINWISRRLESYCDQAIAIWKNPNHELGFVNWMFEDLHFRRSLLSAWEEKIYQALKKTTRNQSEDALIQLLKEADLAQQEWPAALLHTAFLLKGWCGIINRQDQDPKIFPVQKIAIQLTDLLVVILIARMHCDNMPAANDHDVKQIDPNIFYAQCIHYFIERLGMSRTRELLETGRIQKFANKIFYVNRKKAREIWHHAFESAIYQKSLSCLATSARMNSIQQSDQTHQRQNMSVWFCIDDREESFRRHFESIEPQVSTHGVLGFFGIDMKFRSAHHPIPKIHCPPVISPRRIVIEEYIDPLPRTPSRVISKYAAQHFATLFSNRGLLVGALSSLVIGMLSFVPLSLAILAPRLSSRLRKKIRYSEHFRRRTRISLERRTDPKLGEIGFSIVEQAELVKGFIQLSSMQNKLSRIIILMAHGGTNTNNPFRQSYGCGACSGQSGGANSRVFAQMANNPLVRLELEKSGVDLGPGTYFVAAEHDTTTDEVRLLDIDDLQPEIMADLKQISRSLQRAAELNTQERVRRFPNPPFFGRKKYAREHVQMRAMNLAEPRPEYGHAGVCMAVFGRRALTQRLFLDRRSFLVDYDASIDENGTVLKEIMRAAAPVCANIAMDYYISSLDPNQFGAGTKLPLNISALLGVIAGGSGDLKIGLAAQMVERHEPARVLIIVEATPKKIEAALEATPRLLKLANNQWIRIASLAPDTGTLQCRFDGIWQAPQSISTVCEAYDTSQVMSPELERIASVDRIGIWSPATPMVRVGP